MKHSLTWLPMLAMLSGFGCNTEAGLSSEDSASHDYRVALSLGEVSSLPKCTSALVGTIAHVDSPPGLWTCTGKDWKEIKCTNDDVGLVAYANYGPSLWVCVNGSWTDVALPAGPAGPRGATGPAGNPGTSVRVTPEAPGANCPAGGQRIETGIDLDGDHELRADEVTGVSYVCNGVTLTLRCGDGHIDPGEACDSGGESAMCNADCTMTLCGDAKINAIGGEQCDLGVRNGANADCTALCTANVCGDGYTNKQGPHYFEACDDGNSSAGDGCSPSCQLESCGNGILDPGEECDDGNTSDTDTCRSGGAGACRAARCGDGVTWSGVEECDDGADNSYTASCLPDCIRNVCGDGFVNAASEVCDDGASNGETSCPSGAASCTLCNYTCTSVSQGGNATCGDGITASNERCDDRNTSACGTCSADCQSPEETSVATGLIVTVSGSRIVDGETLTMDDGAGTRVALEFDFDATSNGGLPVSLQKTDDAAAVAWKLRDAIMQTSLKVAATANGALVSLIHRLVTAAGNRPISHSVSDPAFYVSGMSGGTGLGCEGGVGCVADAGCLSGSCSANGLCD